MIEQIFVEKNNLTYMDTLFKSAAFAIPAISLPLLLINYKVNKFIKAYLAATIIIFISQNPLEEELTYYIVKGCIIGSHIASIFILINILGATISNISTMSAHPVASNENQSTLISNFFERTISIYLFSSHFLSNYTLFALSNIDTPSGQYVSKIIFYETIAADLSSAFTIGISLATFALLSILLYNLMNGILGRIVPQIMFNIILSPILCIASIYLIINTANYGAAYIATQSR